MMNPVRAVSSGRQAVTVRRCCLHSMAGKETVMVESGAMRSSVSSHSSQYSATVTWHVAPGTAFSPDSYNRDHEWTFPGGEVVAASASPHYQGTASRVN